MGTLLRSAATSNGPFDDLKDHSNGKSTNTHLIFYESLKKHYPDDHVLCLFHRTSDFVGYAKAGHATCTPINNDGTFLSLLTYQSPGNRMSKEPGQLWEHVTFGRYEFTCDGVTFPLFKIEYERLCGRMSEEHFVVVPKTNDEMGQHCSSAVEAILIKVGKWSIELHKEVYVFDDGYWQKSKTLWKGIQKATWDEVILDPTVKNAIVEDVENFFNQRDLYKELGVPWKRGIIFHGIPGNGKTVSIKALMNTLESRSEPVPSLYVKSLDCQQGPQSAIRSIFDRARAMAPCLLILEDLDSLVTDEVRSYFLNEVDGLESNDGILILGSTNHLDKLDPAIAKRPSRFDRKYHFQLPDEEERFQYSEFWRKKLEKTNRIEFSPEISTIVAKLTSGFSFAYLKELFVMSLLIVAHGETAAEDVSSTEISEIACDGSEQSQTVSALEEKIKAQDAVVIPQALAKDRLLRVLKNQCRVLLLEMDNTDTEKWKSGKPDLGRVRIKTRAR